MEKTKKKKIVLTGGGSSGHVMPLLYVWELIKDDFDFLYIAETKGKELSILEKYDLDYKTVKAGKWRRYLSWENFVDLFKIPIGIWQSYWILKKYQPDLVVAKGGHVSVPTTIAAGWLKIPIIAHESDTIMGWANRISGRFATKIAVAFPVGRYGSKHAKKMVWVGMPVKKWGYNHDDDLKIRKYFGIENDWPIILVTGGSQGAVHVNDYLAKYLERILSFANVIHLTGSYDFERVKKNKEKIDKNQGKYLVFDYLYEDYGKAMSIADLIISRAGSTTLSDISNLSKASILIPLPTSASNHQFYNAKSFEDMGASVMVEERDFGKIDLSVLTKSLLEDEERMEEMKAAAATAMKTEGSAQIMADLIKSVLEKN